MPTILVCDDDKQIVEAINIYLTGEGFNVIKAYDGYEALELLEKNEVNLMIVDVMMPGLDGIRTTLKVRETSSIPIIILSAKSEDTDKILGLNIGSSLNGFIMKRAIFTGKASHAGANPEGGVNALNAVNLAMTGINFLRETFRADDAIRVHFYVPEGGQSVNTVPGRTQLEMYVRAKTVPAIFETNAKVTRAIRAGALAINCDLEIQDTPGYFPLHQDENLTELVKKHILDYIDESMIAQGTHGFASGDMGDLSLMWPIVEIGVAGFEGSIHGKDFKTADPEQAYCVPAHYFADTVADLLSDGGASAWKIKEAFKPVMNKKNYLETLDSLNKSTFYEKENN